MWPLMMLLHTSISILRARTSIQDHLTMLRFRAVRIIYPHTHCQKYLNTNSLSYDLHNSERLFLSLTFEHQRSNTGTASVNVAVNVDLGGTISNFFGNGLISVITSTFNSMAETIICSLVAGYVMIGELSLIVSLAHRHEPTHTDTRCSETVL